MKELRSKIVEALLSALPITVIVYIMALLPWFDFSKTELITFSIGAELLIFGIGLFNMGADIAMTPMGTKGVAFAVPMSSVIGVNIYQFLSNNHSKKEEWKWQRTTMK